MLALPTWPLVWIDGLKKITKGFAKKVVCSVLLVSETLLLFRGVLSLFLGILEKIPWNLYYHSIGMCFKWRHCSAYGHHVSYASVRWSVSMRKGYWTGLCTLHIITPINIHWFSCFWVNALSSLNQKHKQHLKAQCILNTYILLYRSAYRLLIIASIFRKRGLTVVVHVKEIWEILVKYQLNLCKGYDLIASKSV